MGERISEQNQAVVFQTPEGVLVWDNIDNLSGAEVIKERESRGNRVVLITSPEEAKKIIEQLGQKQEQ